MENWGIAYCCILGLKYLHAMKEPLKSPTLKSVESCLLNGCYTSPICSTFDNGLQRIGKLQCLYYMPNQSLLNFSQNCRQRTSREKVICPPWPCSSLLFRHTSKYCLNGTTLPLPSFQTICSKPLSSLTWYCSQADPSTKWKPKNAHARNLKYLGTCDK